MNKRASFYRKLIYLGLILLLLYPLSLLSEPATVTDPNGGILSKMRVENGLSQANLGDIDPASETMKLATLGLRGVAVNLLWGKAEEFKKKEDWTNLTATLEQLALLQPNFITFWKYQSWNVSYNVSVQFDDYRDRYYYVREGIQFLQEGVKKNRENSEIPQLLWDLGWFVGQKIGRADEHVQYRRLFKADDEFHGDDPPPGSDERDNWLVSKKEYLNGVSAIDRGKSIGKKSDKIYYSSSPKSQMNYAEAIEEEGSFEKGKAAWIVSADDWRDFGDRLVEHSTGRLLRLGHEKELAIKVAELEKQLEAFDPGLREKIVAERREKLPAEARAALDIPEAQRNEQQHGLAYEATQVLEVSDFDFVQRLSELKPEVRKEAGILGRQLSEERTNLIYTQRYKSDANYDYWALRAEFEQTDTAVDARRKMFAAKEAFENRQAAEEAKTLYEEGFAKWREVVDTYPDLLDPEGVTGDDLMVFVVDYRKVLRSLGENISDDFPLWEVIENFDSEMKFEEEIREHKNRIEQTKQPKEAAESTDKAPAEASPPKEEKAEEGKAEQPIPETPAADAESAPEAL